ncbi:MAG: hypothetical protein IKZ96_00890 [Bacilli bacterium]|nr:hypothetical protein [Bacilli bacterium]
MSERIYVYVTTEKDYKKVFNEGICFLNQDFSMDKDFELVSEDDLPLFLQSIKSSETAYVIKVPEEYMQVIVKDNLRIFPYPILFERQMFDQKRRIVDFYPVLVPALISFMYSEKIGIICNPNYSINFNPNGLKYTKGQLDSVKSKAPRYLKDYEKRNNEDSVTLYCIDKTNQTWGMLKKVYNVDDSINPFPLTELPSVTFEPSKEKKKGLNNNKKGKKKEQFYEE